MGWDAGPDLPAWCLRRAAERHARACGRWAAVLADYDGEREAAALAWLTRLAGDRRGPSGVAEGG